MGNEQPHLSFPAFSSEYFSIDPVIANSTASQRVLLPTPFRPVMILKPRPNSTRTLSRKPRKPQSSRKSILTSLLRGFELLRRSKYRLGMPLRSLRLRLAMTQRVHRHFPKWRRRLLRVVGPTLKLQRSVSAARPHRLASSGRCVERLGSFRIPGAVVQVMQHSG